jgi:RNA polymerase-associated protein CTR9
MAAATQNGYTNGINGTHIPLPDLTPLYPRFSDIPSVIDIPVRTSEGDEEAVSLALTELPDDSDELCDLLTAENAARSFWVTIALAYAKQERVDVAIEILQKGLEAMRRDEDRLKVLGVQCWLELWKCRQAPRVKPTAQKDGAEERDERTKDVWLHKATTTLNEASRISPSYPPLFLARGTLYLLRASLQPSKSSASGSQEHSDRAETLKNALKCFDDALRVSSGKDIFALLGKAKAQYSLNNIPASLALYQQALERAPDMIDPDPRVGVGVCLWTLGHKELASQAWKRSLELNPESKIANVLMGLSLLSQANKFDPTSPEFEKLYREAITSHIQSSFKVDNMYALTCATFAPYFVQRRHWVNVERLARRAIENTDVNAIASDGWFLLARKDHYNGDLGKAAEHYNKADQARGGEDKGWVPAKFGGAQLRVAQGDFDGAKFRLEKMVEKANARSSNLSGAANVEAMTLLGILHAENVFNAQASGSKEDTSQDAKKAIGQLEQVRVAWKDAKRNVTPDPAVLLNLARLYETEAPEKALQCLQEVEKMQLAEFPAPDLEEMDEDEIEEERRIRRELLPPQLLNNIGCFHFQAEKYAEAREDFQIALNACVKQGDRLQQENGDGVDSVVDATDALVSTISFNLARTYEAEGIDEEARKVYTGLLERHPDYIDARTRIAYLTLKSDPDKGAEEIKALLDSDPGNLDVRALYGYYVHGVKKRTLALNEDAEQRHYKHTLQTYDKHDLYSLTGMGNLHLIVAREMPRETDQHKEKRSRMYARAVEFFDKVLALDPKNAFAAQGMGIAIVEEKKDSAAGIQIFSKVRESVKESSVYVNLGHVFTEVKQYSRAIENYELALAKSQAQGGKRDPGILACLGRVWLIRGRQEKKLEAYKTALDFSRQALDAAPENINFRFNVAFVQIQLAQMINTLPESAKSLTDVEAAAEGLDDAIEEFGLIAKEPNPPFPRGDIEQRASMGRNTMKKQIAAALERQKEYEEKNRERLEDARRKREEAAAAREAQRLAEEQRHEEERKRLKEERERIAEEDRMLIERRLEEEKAKEAEMWTTDEETGERRKREKRLKEKKRKKKRDVDSDEEVDGVGTDAEGRKSKPRSGATTATQSDAEGGGRRKKKRRLESRKGRAQSSKYKSADIVEDSSDDEDGAAAQPAEDEASAVETPAGTPGADTPGGSDMFGDEEEEVVQRTTQRKKVARILDDDDEDEDDDAGAPAAGESDHGGDGIGGDD